MYVGDEKEGKKESTRRRHTLHVRLHRWLALEALSLCRQTKVMVRKEARLLHSYPSICVCGDCQCEKVEVNPYI